MHPLAQRRLGARGTGPKEVPRQLSHDFTKRANCIFARLASLRTQVRHAMWFNGLQWEKLEAGKLDAPHRKEATDAITAALKVTPPPPPPPRCQAGAPWPHASPGPRSCVFSRMRSHGPSLHEVLLGSHRQTARSQQCYPTSIRATHSGKRRSNEEGCAT